MNEDVTHLTTNVNRHYKVYLGGRLYYVKQENDEKTKNRRYEVRADIPIEIKKRIMQLIEEEETNNEGERQP